MKGKLGRFVGRLAVVIAAAVLLVGVGATSAHAMVYNPNHPGNANVAAFSLWERTGVILCGPSAYGRQCVEYIDRYYYYAMGRGDARNWTGNGRDYYGSAAAKNLDRFANGSASWPKAGDIMCWDGNRYGHVQIVVRASSTGVTVIEQNSAGVRTYPAYVSNGGYYVKAGGIGGGFWCQGWLRAKGSVTPPPPPPAARYWVASAVVIGNAPGSWATGAQGLTPVAFSVKTAFPTNVRTGPGTQYPVAKSIPAGTWLACDAWMHGTVVRDAWYGTNDGRWYRLK